jgi:hypothetical protein
MWATGLSAAVAEAQPQIGNAGLRLAFDAQRGQLVSFVDLRKGHDFIGANPEGGIWRLDPPATVPGGPIVPGDAREFHWQRRGEQNAIELVWEGFESRRAPDLRVVVNVALDANEPMSRWRIAVEGLAAMQPSAVHFPRVSCIREQDDERLAVPVWMGEQTSKARDLLCGDGDGKRLEWENPGTLSMQCLTLYRPNGPGFYAACDDTAGFAKRFAMFGEKERAIGFDLTQVIERGPEDRTRYESPYTVTLGAVEGHWFHAAETYRAWALEQPWAKQSRVKSGAVADWVAKTGLWVWNRGRSGDVLDPALALQEQAHLPVSVFWHWWHGCAYDTGFPEYLPPREGADAFQHALRRAQDAGVHALVYMNQRLWGMTTRSWTEEQAERYAVKGPDGAVHPEVYNTFTHAPCASMCMGTEFWRNKYAGLAVEAVNELGVDGIYMDQACSSLTCFDPAHGHPLGGGTYWMNGFRLLQADIRERTAASRQVVLAGEGCGEAWLPYLDAMLSLQVSMERYAEPGAWEPIPFFHAVYHGYGVFYGNYSSLTMPPYDDLWPPEQAPKEPIKLLDRKFSTQFRLEQARAFVWGQQPTIANFRPAQLTERAEEMAYVLRLAKLRSQALKYLQDGTMLCPPTVAVPEETLEMSRLSIYAGQGGALRQYRKNYPAVLASLWRAADGAVALVVANIAERPQTALVSLADCRRGIVDASPITILDAEGKRPAGRLEEAATTLPIDLAVQDARIYEFEGRAETAKTP